MDWMLLIIVTDPALSRQSEVTIPFETQALCERALAEVTTERGAFAKIPLTDAPPPDQSAGDAAEGPAEDPPWTDLDAWREQAEELGIAVQKLARERRIAPPLHERWGMCFQVKE